MLQFSIAENTILVHIFLNTAKMFDENRCGKEDHPFKGALCFVCVCKLDSSMRVSHQTHVA